MAYTDCFAAILTRLKEAELYTGDPEFRAAEEILRSCGFDRNRQ